MTGFEYKKDNVKQFTEVKFRDGDNTLTLKALLLILKNIDKEYFYEVVSEMHRKDLASE